MIVFGVPVQVSNFLLFWARSDERLQDNLVNQCHVEASVFTQADSQVAPFIWSGGQELLVDGMAKGVCSCVRQHLPLIRY